MPLQPPPSAAHRLMRAAVNTYNGLLATIRTEQAFRQELGVLAVSLPIAGIVATGIWIWALLVGVVLVVMIVELLNTAIEKLADRVNAAIDPQIGTVKDIGSAAVGVAIVLAGLTWCVAIAHRLALV